MKRLSTAPITNAAQYRVKKGSFEFIQDAYKETIAGMVISLIGSGYDPTVVYILRGCINSGVYPNYSITAGTIFYNGEMYDIDSASYTATGIDVAVFSIITTQFTTNADPVTLTDSTVVNIHNISKMQTTVAATGSGIVDFSSAFRMNFNIVPQLNLVGTGLSNVSGTYPNLFVNTPAPAAQNPVLMWHGSISSNGAVIVRKYGTATVSGVTNPLTGNYTVTHNLGHTNYFVTGIGVGAQYSSPRSYTSPTGTTFSYLCSDDNTGNNTDVELQIWSFN